MKLSIAVSLGVPKATPGSQAGEIAHRVRQVVGGLSPNGAVRAFAAVQAIALEEEARARRLTCS